MDILKILSMIVSVIEIVCRHNDNNEPTALDLCEKCLEVAKLIDSSSDHDLSSHQQDLIKKTKISGCDNSDDC